MPGQGFSGQRCQRAIRRTALCRSDQVDTQSYPSLLLDCGPSRILTSFTAERKENLPYLCNFLQVGHDGQYQLSSVGRGARWWNVTEGGGRDAQSRDCPALSAHFRDRPNASKRRAGFSGSSHAWDDLARSQIVPDHTLVVVRAIRPPLASRPQQPTLDTRSAIAWSTMQIPSYHPVRGCLRDRRTRTKVGGR